LKRNDSVAMRLSRFSSDDNLLDKFLQETEKILSHGLDEVKRTNSEFNNKNNERLNEDVSDSNDIKQVNDDAATTDVKSAEQEEDDDDECTFF